MVFTFFFAAVGFFGMAISLHLEAPWIVPYILFCSVVLGLSFLNTVIYAYIADCLRDHSPEAFASLTLGKLYEFGTFLISNTEI